MRGKDFVTVPYTFHMNDIVSFPFEGFARSRAVQELPPLVRVSPGFWWDLRMAKGRVSADPERMTRLFGY